MSDDLSKLMYEKTTISQKRSIHLWEEEQSFSAQVAHDRKRRANYIKSGRCQESFLHSSHICAAQGKHTVLKVPRNQV